MFRNIIIVSLLTVVFSCVEKAETSLEKGIWRAELQLTENEVLPFNFEVINKDSLKIFNAEEVINVTEISTINDSVRINMPVFEGYISAVIRNGQLEGDFIKESLNRVVPF
ncbi:MAG: hypothetical protein AAF688_07620 [Bacteroidota bacterium]